MKNKILYLFCGLFALLLIMPNVYARELTTVGDNVTEEGTYDSIRLAAGNTILSKATIDGISFVAGNEVIVEGKATYGFYAGNSITINGNIEKDAFIAGNRITIGSDAVIGRDLYAAGSALKIQTNIARDAYIGAGIVDLRGISINGDAHIDSDTIIMDESTVIAGKLSYLETAKVTGLDKASIASIKTRKNREVVKVKVNFITSAYEFIIKVVAAVIVMLALFYIIPSTKEKLDKLKLKIDPIAKTALAGLIVLIVIPIVSIFAVITGIFTPLALIIICLYVIGIYLSTLLTAYVTGRLITNKLFKKDTYILSLVIGIIVVKLAMLVPFIGFWIGVVALIYGLGLIYNYVTKKTK